MWRQNDSVLNTDHLGRMEKGISDTGGTGEIWSILIYLVMGMMFMCCNTFQDISIFWVINWDEKSKSSIILCLIMENKDSAIMLGFQILKLCFPDAVFRYPFIWIILRWNILPVFKFLTHREKKKKTQRFESGSATTTKTQRPFRSFWPCVFTSRTGSGNLPAQTCPGLFSFWSGTPSTKWEQPDWERFRDT